MSISKFQIGKQFHKGMLQSVDPNPFTQFEIWWQEAQPALADKMLNAMTLATVDQGNKPSARIVLLKEFSEDGFIFYTNYESRKGHDIANNPWVACVFWWEELERQIRIEGRVEKTSEAQSDAYFLSRPKSFQLAAIASRQSAIIKNRQSLENNYQQVKAEYIDTPITRPKNWGGYILKPNVWEYWQGGTDRLHDRFEYRKNARGEWEIQRLSP